MSQFTIEINEENFEREVLKSDVPVVVDFWAPWCGPCVAISPVLDELAERYQGKVKVAKINVDNEQGLGAAFEVRSIPTLIWLENGEVVGGQVGFGGKQKLEEVFAQLSGSDSAA